MPRRPPEILLFDLGGVLVDNVMFEALPPLLPTPLDDGEMRRRWLQAPSVQAFERGQTSADDFAAAFIAEWALSVSPDRFLEDFATWPRGPFPGALELLDRLRPDYRLALLTNCNAVHWDRLEPVRRRVHAAFSSHLLGMVKPDQTIFRYVADALDAAPSSICFFDDSLANVEAAQAVGMEAHLVRGVADIEAVLTALGAEP